MKPLVSIVIPTYNCENYIKECIENILEQSYKNIELIIVNDGSNDNTDNIISCLCEKDERIKYFKQINLGPSISRNNGVDRAIGEYIVFIDADDNIDEFYIEKLLNSIIENKSELACCGYIDKSIYGNIKLNDFWKEKKKLNKNEFIKLACNGVGGVLWGKLFKLDIIKNNNIQMKKELFMGEDFIFILEYCKYTEKYSVINENLYYYNRMNENSISSKINVEYLENYLILLKHTNNLMIELKMDKEFIKEIYSNKLNSFIDNVIRYECFRVIKEKKIEQSVENLKLFVENEHIEMYLNKNLNKNRIKLLKSKKYRTIIYYNVGKIKLKEIRNKILRR